MRAGGARFTSPLRECTPPVTQELLPFEDKLVELVEDAKRTNELADAAVYFRSLLDGPWFAVGGNSRFLPASLLEVPLLITYLREAERDPGLLGRTIRCDEDHVARARRQIHVPPEATVQPGEELTVEELLRRMVEHSDNVSLEMLKGAMELDRQLETYRALGLGDPSDRTRELKLSPREYSALFRVLFNATYLGPTMSEKALEYLANVRYARGLSAGVPQGVRVAHKFGERQDRSGQRYLHDCGIVYVPDRPYLLCVMTRGEDMQRLERFIQLVSRSTYEHVTGGARRL